MSKLFIKTKDGYERVITTAKAVEMFYGKYEKPNVAKNTTRNDWNKGRFEIVKIDDRIYILFKSINEYFKRERTKLKVYK